MIDIELERKNEMIISAALGVVFSVGIVYFLHKYPGRPFDYATDRYIDNVSVNKKDDDALRSDVDDLVAVEYNDTQKQSVEGTDVNHFIENMNEDDFVTSTKKMQSTFGISEDNIRYAVRQTKDDIKRGRSLEADYFTYSQILDMLVIGGIVCTCIYFIDIEAHGLHGDISKVLHALFPLELSTLGVSNVRRGGEV